MRQAFVILAHDKPEQLLILLDLLDDPEFDIYLHIDADAAMDDLVNTVRQRWPEVQFVERRPIYWGTVSAVDVELDAFEKVLSSGVEYSHIHLISGRDLPIKSNAGIKEFFSSHSGSEFVLFYDESSYTATHARCHYPFPNYYQRKNAPLLKYRLLKELNIIYHILEKMVFAHKWRHRDVNFIKGPQWASITPAFAAYLVENRDYFHSLYAKSYAPDEFLIGTALASSPYMDRHVNDCRRHIVWAGEVSHPETLTCADYDALMESDAMFARKFDMDVDAGIIDKIVAAVRT